MKNFKAFKFKSFVLYTDNASDLDLVKLKSQDINSGISFAEDTNGIIRDKNGNFHIFEWNVYHVFGLQGNKLSSEDNFFSGTFNKNNNGTILFKNFVGTASFKGQILLVDSKKVRTRDLEKNIKMIEKRIENSIRFNFNSNGITSGTFQRRNNEKHNFFEFIKVFNLMRDNKVLPYIRYVEKHPNKQFSKTVNEIPLSSAQSIDDDGLIDIFSGRSQFQKGSKLSFSSQFNGFYPQTIIAHEDKTIIDTGENQFVKFFLKMLISKLDGFIQDLNNMRTNDGTITIDSDFIKSVQKMKILLQHELANPFFNQISKLTFINQASTTLTKQYGYKQLFYQYINIKNVPVGAFDVESLIALYENKSVDKMYEYICLFRLVDILGYMYSNSKTNIKTVNNGYTISLSETNGDIQFNFYGHKGLPDAMLTYQTSFSRKNKKYNTFSINLRPDITLTIKTKTKVIYYHFDSKFKIGYDGSNKDEDIGKMRTYCDAISNTKGAFVLYPGKQFNIYHRPRDFRFQGVGAFPLNVNSNINDKKLAIILAKILIHYSDL
ncbi:hypothetical protein LRA02_25750 [Lentilactobacillus rapi]|uniref:DUF2357 domain-containing protein n=1 Tax=Lentilactobacillus rapi TaxID=481723 RepID=A0A512PR82_9LACO|nr:DUF2357 domain-containing protein [Lentilactobacillus rapi]GEP73707.1 hypothetical protein LRA02_25750 [Lentilactobacillus rapi]